MYSIVVSWAHSLFLLQAAAVQTAKTHPNGIDYLINNAGREGALHILEAYVYMVYVFSLYDYLSLHF